MDRCLVCKEAEVVRLLDFGKQALCNRFLQRASGEEYTPEMVIAQCDACGLIQIAGPVPATELLPRYEWITYKEPEDHLDELAGAINALPGITSRSTVAGVSFKDASTLARLERLGVGRTWQIDPAGDLGVDAPGAGVETVQDRLTIETATDLAEKYGHPEVVVVRHILEHAHDPLGLMEAMRALVAPDGYVVFEVPDCTRGLEGFDYSSLWEEHILYFTSETFQRSIDTSGFERVMFKIFKYPFEDSLVTIVRPRRQGAAPLAGGDWLGAERSRARAYSAQFTSAKASFREFVSGHRKADGGVALFGAGHLACTFVNLLELDDYIDFVVDDDSRKQGLLMPGSALPIYGSDALVGRGVKLCLLGLNPDVEDKVVANNRAFVEQGGEFYSIFSVSERAVRSD